MKSASAMAAKFDGSSKHYDATRTSLSEAAMDRVARRLAADGVRSVVEAGVGTGRIAGPLQERQLEVVGIDISEGMLAKARAKGVAGLLRADADHPPFRPKAFDAALLSHVLHLLKVPVATFRSLEAVTKEEIGVLLTMPESLDHAGERALLLRQAVYNLEDGLGRLLRVRGGSWRNLHRREMAFLDEHPPTELVTIERVPGDVYLRKYIAMVVRPHFGVSPSLGARSLDGAVERAVRAVGASSVVFSSVDQMAIWKLGAREGRRPSAL